MAIVKLLPLALVAICLAGGCKKPLSSNKAEDAQTTHPQTKDDLIKTEGGSAPAGSGDENESERIDRLVSLGKLNLIDAMNWIGSHVPLEQQDRLRMTVAKRICASRFESLPECLQYVKSSEFQKELVKYVAFEWARRDPAGLTKLAELRLTGENKNCLLNETVTQLSKSGDYQNSAKIVDLMPYSGQRSDALTFLALRWSGADIEAALTWGKTQQLPEDRLRIMKILANKLGESKDLDRLEALANTETSREVKEIATWNMANIIAQKDGPNAASAWVKTLPADLQEYAQNAIIKKYVEGDLGEFTKYIATLEPRSKNTAVLAMSSKLAGINPVEAAKWVLNLPDGGARELAVSGLVGRWYNVDSIQLSEWINSLKRGPIRDIALESLVSHLRDTDPKAAIDVAKQIDNPQKRLSLLQSVSAQK